MEIRLNISGKTISVTIHGSEAKILPAESMVDSLESPYQITEGREYEFVVSDSKLTLQAPYAIIPSHIDSIKHTGRIRPNTYVGTLPVQFLEISSGKCVGSFELEVVSSKTDYRSHYRKMLDDIAQENVNLILQHSSPVVQKLQTSFDNDQKTDYQQFAFLKSILESEEFTSAIDRILHFPVTRWAEEEIETDIRRVKRIDGKAARRFASSKNRIAVPSAARFPDGIRSIPLRLTQNRKIDTVDTPENRFIKHALEHFVDFIGNVASKAGSDSRLKKEATELENQLSEVLHHTFFQEISALQVLPLNSPVLQRKEGYRDILRTYLMFDLAAKLQWKAGEDIYGAGKKNVAVLYEYWLLFQLLKIAEDLFELEVPTIDQLITSTDDKLGINLLQGKPLKIKGVYCKGTRKLNVEFHYNKTFSSNGDHLRGGSWTKGMRPDYTFSFWPADIGIEEAEELVLVTHIHFDAKYKVDRLEELFGTPEDDTESGLQSEKQEQTKGNYKRADLLKMHAYRDAIRRTGGAYVLYPGNKSEESFKGFHEIIPGLGAFAVNPSSENGADAITSFLKKVLETLENRVSQWDRVAYRQYEIHKDLPGQVFDSSIPELTKERNFLPSEISVLIGFIKSTEQKAWIEMHGLYNTRTGKSRAGIQVNSSEASAQYILMYEDPSENTFTIFKLSGAGPTVVSKEEMTALNYPDPRTNEYLLFSFDVNQKLTVSGCNLPLLKNYIEKKPFVATLEEIMQHH